MKINNRISYVLTIISMISLLAACKNNAKSTESIYEKAYKMAADAKDYHSACNNLLMMLQEDSAGKPWIYDSLAFYHYFYLAQPNSLQNNITAKYFVNKGLELNSKNIHLRELQAKILLNDQKDTQSYAAFENLWNETKDYTFWWDMTVVEMLRGKTVVADSMIKLALNDAELDKKTVRSEDPQYKVKEEIPARAAFLYLRAQMEAPVNPRKCMETLEECLKIAPDFFLPKLMISQIQQQAAQGYNR